MKKTEIEPWDWQRILFGQAPAEFLLEVFLRTLVIYLLLIVALRLLGKRMDAQMTLTEMAVIITLGAIVSVPMQIPDRGIVVGMIALLCVVVFQRGVNWLTVKSKDAEEITQGTTSILVKDGLLQLDEMQKAGISKQNIFSELRSRQIFNLGLVKRFYFEGCGLMNVYKIKEAKPGLPVLPSGEHEFIMKETQIEINKIACTNCGFVTDPHKRNDRCPNCEEKKWIEAIY